MVWWQTIRYRRTFRLERRLDFASLTPHECWIYFRFKKDDIAILCEELHIPVEICTKTRYCFSGQEALLILLWRLSFSCRWSAGVPLFGRSQSALSEITHWMLNFLLVNFVHLLNTPFYYTDPTRLRFMADAVNAKCPLSNCVGFIDCTLRRMCRPTIAQQAAYNGHKKTHGLKWQNIVAPDGIIINQWGPYEGRRSDPWIQGESNIVGTIVGRFRFPVDSPESIALHTPQNPNSPNLFRPGPPPFIQYCVFGDKGYFTHHTGAVIGAYRRAAGVPDLPPAEQAFNVAMSKGRIAVEWGFLDVVQTWGYLDCTKGMMVWKTPVAHYYQAASLLTNFHCCLYGNRTSKYFGLPPPSLADYIRMHAPPR